MKQAIARDNTKATTWKLEPASGPVPRQVFMRDVKWTAIRAVGEVVGDPGFPADQWTKVFWKMGGFIDAESRVLIRKSSFARFDPDGSAWYVAGTPKSRPRDGTA